jgi:hypothetical protein
MSGDFGVDSVGLADWLVFGPDEGFLLNNELKVHLRYYYIVLQ